MLTNSGQNPLALITARTRTKLTLIVVVTFVANVMSIKVVLLMMTVLPHFVTLVSWSAVRIIFRYRSNCFNTRAENATCSDTIKNEDETDVDCGGGCGATCAGGKACLVNDDCASFICDNNVCGTLIAPYCSYKATNNSK